MERHGHYPHDDKEEEYERQIQEEEKKVGGILCNTFWRRKREERNIGL